MTGLEPPAPVWERQAPSFRAHYVSIHGVVLTRGKGWFS